MIDINTLEECQNLRMETSTIIVHRSRFALDFAKRKGLGEGAVSRGVARNEVWGGAKIISESEAVRKCAKLFFLTRSVVYYSREVQFF